MKPGRELDTLIAEKIFGWHLDEHNMWAIPGNTFLIYASCTNIPSYSTDISAAWEVVEKFKAVTRLEKRFNDDTTKWFCELSLGIGEGCCTAYAETAPHAICLAALEATQLSD